MINDEDRIMTEESYVEDFSAVAYDLFDEEGESEIRDVTLVDFKDHIDDLIKTYGADALVKFYKHGDYQFELVEMAIETDHEYYDRMADQKAKIQDEYTEKLKELEKLQDQIQNLREKIET